MGRGDRATHDRLVLELIESAQDRVEVIVLAQLSLAVLEPEVQRFRVPVLNSACEGFQHAREILERCSQGDPQTYRSREEVQEWREQRDPIARHRHYLMEQGLLTGAEAARIEQEAVAQIDEAVRFAEASPLPELDSLTADIYAPAEGWSPGGFCR